ncbi:peroxiredoxin family protein [Candidatus Poribacteria bacterium]|nr:peroxiredoxin family protein [Candidatus Poribacteria bacterium]
MLGGNYQAITALGAEVITISHEPVATNKRLAEQHKIKFPSLSDTEQKIIRAYDVVAPFGFPAITFFVIDKDGIIRWRSRVHSNINPNDLPPIDDLLDEIKKVR